TPPGRPTAGRRARSRRGSHPTRRRPGTRRARAWRPRDSRARRVRGTHARARARARTPRTRAQRATQRASLEPRERGFDRVLEHLTPDLRGAVAVDLELAPCRIVRQGEGLVGDL